MTFALRPYQLDAIHAVEREWFGVRSTLLVLPTGAGKTVVFVEIARRQHGRVLVLAHRDELITQAVQKFQDAGVVAEVEKADRRAGKMSTSPVVVASVASMRGKRLRSWDPAAFGTIIIDEAHHAPAPGYRAIMDHFAGARVLGVTATPDRSDEIGLGNIFESVAFSMEILDLVDQGYLVDVNAKTIVVEDFDISAVKTKGRGTDSDLVAKQIEDALTNEKMMHSIAAPLVAEAAGRSTLIFMPGVESSMMMRKVLGGYVDPALIEHVDGQTHPVQRSNIMADFRSKKVQIMTNCMVLTEGFDAPNVEVVAICRPTKSRALFSQMVGRGTRPDPNNPAKKQMTLLNFVPKATGKHTLANPLDILGGRDIEEVDEKVLEEAKELLKSGMTPREAMTQAERAIAERIAEEEAKARAEKERLERLRSARNQQVFVDAAYHAGDYDAYGNALVPNAGRRRASDAQITLLRNMGVELSIWATADEAQAEIGRTIARRKKGMCTPKQEKVLKIAGLRTDITVKQASKIIDELVKNRWQPTPEITAQWGVKKG